MAWFILFIAGLLEVIGVILNEIARTKRNEIVVLAVAFICSFST